MRTLIAQGDAQTRAVLTWLLKDDARFDVAASVDTGERAVSWVQPLDAALIDIALPGLDALQTVRTLRDRYPDITIVVVGEVDVPYLRAAALDAGADSYVSLGVEPSHLTSLLALRHPASGGGSLAEPTSEPTG